MSAPLKTNTLAPSTGKGDWVHVMTNELKSSLDNEPEVYDVKVGKCKWRQQAKEEVKECQQRKEAEC